MCLLSLLLVVVHVKYNLFNNLGVLTECSSDAEAYHGQVHSACRGALNVVAKAAGIVPVDGVSYSLDISINLP